MIVDERSIRSYAKQVTTELGIEEDEDRAGNIPSSQTELAEEDTIKAEGNDDAEDDIGLDVVLDLSVLVFVSRAQF